MPLIVYHYWNSKNFILFVLILWKYILKLDWNKFGLKKYWNIIEIELLTIEFESQLKYIKSILGHLTLANVTVIDHFVDLFRLFLLLIKVTVAILSPILTL